MRLSLERRVVRRESFYLQGDRACDVLVLCAGRLKMTQLGPDGEQSILRLTGPGEAFGALDPADGTYSTGAEALEPSHALIWDRAALDVMTERYPVLLRNELRIVSERMRALEQRCRELLSERVPHRVAHTLVRLVGEIGRPADGGALVALSREELAQMAGTTLFTVSRLLGEWQERGLVTPRREAVCVLDTRGLAALADGSRVDVASDGKLQSIV